MRRATRAAIVGTKGFERLDESVEIECFSWNEVTRISNPSDYDAILFLLTSLTDPDVVNWPEFFNNFTAWSTLEVLANRGHIAIVGDPRFWPIEPVHVPGQGDGGGRAFLSWTGINFFWEEKSGKTKTCAKIDPSTEPYLDYIEKITRWHYCLTDCRWPKDVNNTVARVLHKTAKQVSSEFRLERICENRYGGLIVFAISLRITVLRNFGLDDYRPEQSRVGQILFLPQIDMPQEEVVAMVLARYLRIRAVLPEPSWASSIVAPLQPCIDKGIAKIADEISVLQEDLKNLEEKRAQARRCVNLLYKLGDELEEIVREILGSLGATIELPTERGKEDGWLRIEIGDEVLEGVLEIKGTRKGQFTLEGLRQLMEWKKRGKLNRQKKYKGIFIGNSHAEKDLSNREIPFSESWLKTAELDEIAVLETRNLYSLYSLDCEGKLDRNRFWEILFRTNGVFSLENLP